MNVDEITGTWDYGTLPKNISIGNNCWLERKKCFERFKSNQNPGLILGSEVNVYTWTSFTVEPEGVVAIGDQSVIVGAIFMCAESIILGKSVVVSYNVTIADCDFHPKDSELRKQDAIANVPEGDKSKRPAFETKPVIIEDDVWIGIGAIILKGVRIGKGARIGAGAVVTSDVPAGTRIAGNPARVVSDEVQS